MRTSLHPKYLNYSELSEKVKQKSVAEGLSLKNERGMRILHTDVKYHHPTDSGKSCPNDLSSKISI